MKIANTQKIWTMILFLGSSSLASAQITLTLEETIDIARNNSIAALQAETGKELSYWNWRTYKSNYNPRLTLNGTLLDFNRTFQSVTQPDGNILFQPITNNNSTLGLRINQSIAATGTNFFVESQLNRFDNFNNDVTRYSGNPIFIGLSQTLFGFNDLKWARQVEPLAYEESIKDYASELEDVSIEATRLFFEVLSAQINYEIASYNISNADTLLLIGERRYATAYISRNDLLQLRLAKRTAEKEILQAEVDLVNNTQEFKAFIGLPEEQSIELIVPEEIPDFIIMEEIALEQATMNRSDIIRFQRLKREAERDYASAKAERGLNVDIFATYGLTNRADVLNQVYQDPTDQQQLNVGFSIPILDWGRSTSRLQSALARQRLTDYTVAQEKINFEQEILSEVRQFKVILKQVEIAEETKEIAEERYRLERMGYLEGSAQVNINDLNTAQRERDNARMDLINSLSAFWDAYYTIRALTLYDFVDNASLVE